MTDTRLLNWMHNRRVDVTWQGNHCEVTLYDQNDLPVLQKTALTVRHALKEAYNAYNGILELEQG